jgi:hypothetical protein
MHDMSQHMRQRLEAVGITLDEAKPPMHKPVVQVTQQPVDRDAVREVLVARGASARDLAWLVASAPSLAAARAFTPPRTIGRDPVLPPYQTDV